MSPCLCPAWPGFALLSVPTKLPEHLWIQVPLWSLYLLHFICPCWGFSGQDELLTCLSRTAHPVESHAQGFGVIPSMGFQRHRCSWCRSICGMDKGKQRDPSAARNTGGDWEGGRHRSQCHLGSGGTLCKENSGSTKAEKATRVWLGWVFFNDDVDFIHWHSPTHSRLSAQDPWRGHGGWDMPLTELSFPSLISQHFSSADTNRVGLDEPFVPHRS